MLDKKTAISFVVGTISGSIVGATIDLLAIKQNKLLYSTSWPSGVTCGLGLGGIFGIISNFLLNDNGIVGGIAIGSVTGILGARYNSEKS